MKKTLIGMVKLYKKLSTPLWRHNIPVLIVPDCRFYPSCSEYAIDAIAKYGAFRGTIKSVSRILRCNPLSQGGIDNA